MNSTVFRCTNRRWMDFILMKSSWLCHFQFCNHTWDNRNLVDKRFLQEYPHVSRPSITHVDVTHYPNRVFAVAFLGVDLLSQAQWAAGESGTWRGSGEEPWFIRHVARGLLDPSSGASMNFPPLAQKGLFLMSYRLLLMKLSFRWAL